jgi:hypothetical protein
MVLVSALNFVLGCMLYTLYRLTYANLFPRFLLHKSMTHTRARAHTHLRTHGRKHARTHRDMEARHARDARTGEGGSGERGA